MTEKTSTKSTPKRAAASRGRTRRPPAIPKKTVSKAVPKQITPPKRTSTKKDALRLVPLGGLEEIGRNMSFMEYKDDIVIVDMGFQFPEEDTPGIDYIIPNISYLQSKKENIRGVILTHGHLDHIGAVPYLMSKLGNPPIYTLKLTKAMVEKRQEEFVNAPKLNIVAVKYGDKVKLGTNFEIEFFGVQHTIPDTTGIIAKTPVGNIAHFADFRIDYDLKGNPQHIESLDHVGKQNIHTLMIDSTNAMEKGRSVSESDVEKNLEMLFKEAKGRIIVATFSSMLTRIAEMIKIAEKLDRKVIINGRSMEQNVQIAKQLGYMKIKEGTIIPKQEVNKHKDNKLFILSTGAQGESNAGLMRIVNGEHKHIQLKKGDSMIFSSSVIPGNERSVQNLRDIIARQGVKVITYKHIDIHASGHAPQDDIKMVIEKVKPKYVVPVHGNHFMLVENKYNAMEVGIKEDNVKIFDNGQVGLITKDDFELTDEYLPAHYIMVDGLGVGDVEEVVLRDRLVLAEEGMIVIIATLDRKTGRLLKNPDIISRGFIYLRDNQDLLKDMRMKIKNIVNRIPRHQKVESDYIKALFRDQVGQFVYDKTQRRPMILPVIIEV